MAEKIALEIDIDAKGSVRSLGQLEEEAQRLNEELRKVPLGSKAFKDLQTELIGVNKEIKNTELSLEALDNEQVASELGSVAGAVGDVSAAFILLGGEGGALEETVQNIEKAIGVSMAFKGAIEGVASGRKLLNNVIKNSSALQKANNAINVLAGTIMKAFGGSVNTTSVAFKGLRAAIISTGIGALVVGIGLLIENFDKLASFITKTSEKQRMLNETVEAFESGATEANKQVNEMAANFKLARDGVIDKKKALDEYNEKFGDTLGKAESFNEAEKLFIEKTDAYIQAAGLRAQAQQLFTLAAEANADSLLAMEKDQTTFVDKTTDIITKGLAEAIDYSLGYLTDVSSLQEELFDKVGEQRQKEVKQEKDALAEKYNALAADLLRRAILIEQEFKLNEKNNKLTKEGLISVENRSKKLLESLKSVGNESIKARDFFGDLMKAIAAEESEDVIIEELKASEKAAKLKAELRIKGLQDEIERERQLKLQQLEWNKETELQELQLSGELTNDLRLALEADYARQKVEINEEANRKILLNQQALEAAKIDLAISGIGALMNLTSAFAKDNEKSQRRAFEINKKLQIAQAIMQTYQGANAIFASAAANPSSVLFPAQPFITAGIAIANGLANVAQISKQQFQSGQPGSGDLATPSFQGGGAAPALQPANTSLLVPQQQSQVYVTETDITNVQNQVSVIQGMGGFG